MAEMSGTEAWRRIGDALRRKRESMEPRWTNLALFASERGINYRVAWDLEHGARENYRRQTRRQAEIAYAMPLGWIDSALASGGEPPDDLGGADPLDALQPAATEWEREQARQYIENLRRAVQARIAAERDGQQRPA